MADQSEMRMEVVRKVYAEVLLNTSKEAASRIMASERKALYFQHELSSLKQESLRLLLRLKQQFSSKIEEAEARSLNQQLKIEELEAQLSEAEGIIVDLRDELNNVQEKLEIMRHNRKHSFNGHTAGIDEPVHDIGIQEEAVGSSLRILPRVSEAKPFYPDCDMKVASPHPVIITPSDDMNFPNLSKLHLEQLRAGSHDFTSIIMQNSETDLYRNGCTQRVRALERNLFNVNHTLGPGNQHSLANVQSETIPEEAGNINQYPMTDSAPITSNLSLPMEQMSKSHQTQLISICPSWNRREKQRKLSSLYEKNDLTVMRTCGKKSRTDSFGEESVKTIDINVETGDEKIEKTPKKLEGKLLQECRCYKDKPTRPLRSGRTRRSTKYIDAIVAIRKSSRKTGLLSRQQPFLCKCKTSSSGEIVQPVESPIEVVVKKSKKNKIYSASVSDDWGTNIQVKENKICLKDSESTENREACCDRLSAVSVSPAVVDVQWNELPNSERFDNAHGQTVKDSHPKFTFYRKYRKNGLAKLDENIDVSEQPADVSETRCPKDLLLTGDS